MLILTRRPGESLILDGGIRVDVLATDGRTVKLGIVAPDSVRILRAEIVASVAEETVRAAAMAAKYVAAHPGTRPALTAPPDLSPAVTPRAPGDATPPATAP